MPEKIDVLLINPGEPQRIFQQLTQDFVSIEPPVFAGLFATYLRQKDLSVAIIDQPALGWTAAEVVAVATLDYQPVLIVLVVYGAQPSASTQNMTAAGNIARRIKEYSNIPVMMTGTHPAALPRVTLVEEKIDFVCDREGPITIWKTVVSLKERLITFHGIPSLWWKDYSLSSKGEIISPNSSQPLIKDLNTEMPGIAWDLLPVNQYRSHNWHSFDHINKRHPYAVIHTSLGCPYRCHFCCINAPFVQAPTPPPYRMWSPETVLKEIDFLVEEYNIVNLKFVDEMFVLNPNHVLGICRLLRKRPYKVNIWAYARVDTVQDQFLDALKSAGVNWLCLGIESASKHVRDGALKKYGNEEIINTVRRIQAAGIYVIGNFIFGLPDDTTERMHETFDLATELNCEYANFYSAMAYPGSPLYKQAVVEGRDLPDKWEDYSQHGYSTKPLSNDYCTSAEILGIRDRAHNGYFTNLLYLDMVKRKFGHEVVEHIGKMVRIPLKRKLLEQ